MGDDMRPYALKAGEGWQYRYGVDVTLKVPEVGLGRRVAITEYVARAGEEPHDHVHAMEDEMFYVLEGSITLRAGGESHEMEAGGFVFVPRGVTHGYTIAHGGEVRLLVITAPYGGESGGWGGRVSNVEEKGELISAPPGRS